ncbi:Glu/Leu/Phe/Val dehydrogenase dimerization domain-containing protein [Amycolatopsis sp. YIM 10]|uniref:Glu/Leu/Phe/Val dehydrogenase dimerization domain-containing protein n=1 Tax=Amycolatopsis sp. YIM 10 TaxID=2653857 RepID=UPI0012901749|nr:Glu/Leu/Phe/Val dehydrogenase dimerization domain-containing protein [Amycolatopsis sp. YIM 10]QFU93232.1 Phenylalanine dehydrogenase [Amycolatopsis sp. YIM 10]
MSTTGVWEHEEVVLRRGTRSGLPITVAAHSRSLGPAIGGCRLRHYPDWRDGLADALRLAKAMTLKCAVAGVPFGGGKSVVGLPATTSPELRLAALEDLGELIGSLGGSYIPGPDVGTGPADMLILRRHAAQVFCLPATHGGVGSSSGPTAVGVLAALRAGARHVFGSASVTGRKVVISGFGAVGSALAASLAADGAVVVVSDVDDAARAHAQELGYGWVHPEDAPAEPADIFVPAAVGGVLTPSVISLLTAPLIVGPANNQLTEDSVAHRLDSQGFTWIPDFVASAGGIIYTLAREIRGLSHDRATAEVGGIEQTTDLLLTRARANGTTPLAEAIALADTRTKP